MLVHLHQPRAGVVLGKEEEEEQETTMMTCTASLVLTAKTKNEMIVVIAQRLLPLPHLETPAA